MQICSWGTFTIFNLTTLKYTDVRFIVEPHIERVNPLTAKLFNWNFHPIEVVDRVKGLKIIPISQNGGQLF